MNNIRGTITKKIFGSENNYMVLLFKIKENDIDNSYNHKTITVTGYFYDLEENLDYSLTGMITNHKKYGEQFQVTSYQKIIPEDKNSIVSFFSSDLFKGIGETKAIKIYEILGEDAINKIKNDSSSLDQIKNLTEKNKQTIISKLQELNQSTDTIIHLNDLGFNTKDATLIYKTYREKTLDILNDNIYNLYYDIEKLSFLKIDNIALKNNILKDDIKRIEAGIIESMRILSLEKGDTYSLLLEIHDVLNKLLHIEVNQEILLECFLTLEKKLRIVKLNDNEYQLIDFFEAENNIVKRITYLNNKKDLLYKKDYLDKKIHSFEKKNDITYDESQKLAIKNAFLKNFLIITGGPGTGKTTIMKSIVSLYQDIFSKGNIFEDEIALLAPTGRASKRIMEATLFKASTIHRFLKWNKDTNKFQVNEYNKSDVKLVIIDEASMVDTLLFSSLLKGLRYDTRIILIGDVNQLPSVGAGYLLKDLIDSEVFPIIKLEKLYRQSLESDIVTLAYNIQKQEIDDTLFIKNNDLLFYEADSLDLKEKLEKIVLKYKKVDYHDLQIMVPIYKTLNGIDNLNLLLQNIFNPKNSSKNEIVIYDILYREGDKVLQLQNMPDDNVYNGDIGIILEIDNIKREVVIDYDSNVVTFNSNNFNNFTLGYVISIHKSQGSEFNTVIIPILKEYGRMLYQKLIYTGVTRSKQKLILLGEKKAFEYSVLNNHNDLRKTNLQAKINKRYN